MKVINLTIFYISRYTVTFASVTTVTIVMTATLLGFLSENELRQLYYHFPITRVPIGVCELVPRGNSSSTSLATNLSRLPLVNHLSPCQPGPFFWTSSLNATNAAESLLVPTAPEQLQPPTNNHNSLCSQDTLVKIAACSFTITC